ncbi:helix-turn-helix domain-containing protein [Paraburkholderia sp. BL25I1N1]|uniref:winged helix-turn-helix transcriptional regulator n=1 Tax=Paraburkholderia sp. BL25I1N1 TaxID=1938804 RepID=UPI000D05B61F|nr:helix-turn-helix domain-containing protein [Paraburkholderia sp. BL25I1N1]PRY04453.1 HxlR family transcriptional regulator [Paraburkholderia sp. BL25I1N1]
MSWDETSESLCQIARGLSVFGDRWTLLIMREISMGVRRFEDIQAQTGMSSNLLAMRLKRLEEDEIIERRQYSTHSNRFEYYATPKGKELDGVLLAIRAWALRWGGFPPGAEPAVGLVYRKTGETIDALWQVPRSKKPFSFSDTVSTISDGFAKEREARAAAFKASRLKSADTPARKSRVAAKPAPKRKTDTSGTPRLKLAKPAAKEADATAAKTPARKKVTSVKKASKAA